MSARPRWSRILAVVGVFAIALVVAVVVPEKQRDRKRVERPPLPEGTFPYADSPIIGEWKEIARIPCDSGREYEPFDPIKELIIYASSEFTLTKVPLETRINYSGRFEVDDQTRALRMYSFRGTFPPDIDGEGDYEFDARTGELVLHDMWLNPLVSLEHREDIPVACGHRFVPIGDGFIREFGALYLRGALDGRKDTSRQVRADGSFETMLHCLQLVRGNDYAEYLLRERMTVGGSEPAQVNFIRLSDKSETEVLMTIYEPANPEQWRGYCRRGGKREFITNLERGNERCSLRLHREGEGDQQVWTGTSNVGDCTSDREGDAHMIVQMRIDEDTVELWERGYDEHGQQTWGSDAPIRYQPATAAWPEPGTVFAPVADEASPLAAARLLSFIAGSSSNAAQVDYRNFSPAKYSTCPIAIGDRELPEGAKLLHMKLSVPPGTYGVEGANTYSYLFMAYPLGARVGLDVVRFKERPSCGGGKIPADKIAWDRSCTIVFEAKDDESYVGKTIADCPSEFKQATRLEIDATIRDGAFDYWPRWYDDAGQQVLGMRTGPIQFRRESAP